MLVSDLASRPARPARSRVLRLRGLPYRALEDEIFRFLEPLVVTRVHLCRRNGEHIRTDAVVCRKRCASRIIMLYRKDYWRGLRSV
jgi:hypothetical protein